MPFNDDFLQYDINKNWTNECPKALRASLQTIITTTTGHVLPEHLLSAISAPMAGKWHQVKLLLVARCCFWEESGKHVDLSRYPKTKNDIRTYVNCENHPSQGWKGIWHHQSHLVVAYVGYLLSPCCLAKNNSEDNSSTYSHETYCIQGIPFHKGTWLEALRQLPRIARHPNRAKLE